jgi:AraC family transcriptional regulator
MFGPHPAQEITTLVELQTPDFTICEKDYSPTLRIPKHEHDSMVMSIPLRGAFLEFNSFSSYLCQQHGLSINPAGERHSSRFGDIRSSCLVISSRGENPHMSDWIVRSFSEPLYIRDPRASTLALHISREMKEIDTVTPILIEGLVLELMAFAARGAVSKDQERAPKWLATVRDYLNANINQRHQLKQLANAAGVHQTTLCRSFRKYYKRSVGEYIRDIRLERSAKDLADRDRSLIEVAGAAGYYDQSHFANAFKRRFGMTPTDYRLSLGASCSLDSSCYGDKTTFRY